MIHDRLITLFVFDNFSSKFVNCISFVDQDELLWAAAWLHRATNDKSYLDYLGQAGNTGGARTEFSWDDKFVGAQVLVAKVKDFIHLIIFFYWTIAYIYINNTK